MSNGVRAAGVPDPFWDSERNLACASLEAYSDPDCRNRGGFVRAYLFVFLGAGVGGAMRHGVNMLTFRLFGPSFPFGTLAVNVLGSFAIGVLAGWFALRGDVSQGMRLFLTTGILGGFTTFSAFSLDAALFYQRGEFGAFAAYVGGSVVLSLAALFAGIALFRPVHQLL